MGFACTDDLSKQQTKDVLPEDSSPILGAQTVNAASAVHMTYYGDDGCSTYQTSADHALGECFNYAGDTSERYYDCDSSTHSVHYEQPDCQGTGTPRSFETGTCLNWNDNSWLQFACTNDLSKLQTKDTLLGDSSHVRKNVIV